jgi:hypothetical protein
MAGLWIPTTQQGWSLDEFMNKLGKFIWWNAHHQDLGEVAADVRKKPRENSDSSLGRAGARGGARVARLRERRIASITLGCSMAARSRACDRRRRGTRARRGRTRVA